MRFIFAVAASVASLIAIPLTSAHPLLHPTQRSARWMNVDEPCGQIRGLVAKWMADNEIVPKELSGLFELLQPPVPPAPIRPSLAFACLKSIPLYADVARKHVDYLAPLVEWQSTVDYLRDPPKGYLSEGVDLTQGLKDIAAKLQPGKKPKYPNMFEFLTDLHTLLSTRVRDGHVSIRSLLFDLFTFERGVQFVSISDDGLSLPRFYLRDDVKYTADRYVPSPITAVNGVAVLNFFLGLSLQSSGSHDPDARFNTLFPTLSKDANLNHAEPSDIYTLGFEDTTIVEFQNGTILKFDNTAYVRANFSTVSSGTDLYNIYGQGNGTTPSTFATGLYHWADKNWTASHDGFPAPFKATPSESMRTFLLPEAAFEDTAVLAINSFVEAENPNSETGSTMYFRRQVNNITQDFIAAARASNRTKLILDLQGNGGGFTDYLTIVYLHLFPPSDLTKPYNWPIVHQMRAHPQLQWIGTELESRQSKNLSTASPLRALLDLYITPNNTRWSSFQDFLGPVSDSAGNNFTHYSLINVTVNQFDPFPFPPTSVEPPFAPEDIIIVTDGECASACAILTSILTNIHGVKTIALGGRPLNQPMQAIGQVKAGPVNTFRGFVAPDPNNASTPLPPGVTLPLSGKPPIRMPDVLPRASLYLGGANVDYNLGNMFPYDLDKGEIIGDKHLPLQMRYEAAHCKLFFTWEMMREVTAIWKAVKEVAWGGGKCVKGSSTGPDGRIGDKTVTYSKEVEDKYKLGKGPGSLER
ncbi:hypothetical protein QBC40DRAFT_234455 [Triangularia verruculosa]|uniref:CPAF-like PDZ domain-containing protein n=1 Tax=Triangularia verruculosa TaxID=2587418 RepID=A0AAN6X966_9PEZI|nr:hypothetical protein QBC40DRAFT_234455 [Triangularia verruculosa]